MKGLRSRTYLILPVMLVLVLLVSAIASACATSEPRPSPSISPAPKPSYDQGAPSTQEAGPKTNGRGSGRGSDDIGLATGGAKDINNFRENIQNNYLPLATDITYEGLFYDYYFDTGQTEQCNKLFCPSYSYAATQDPFSYRTDYYLSVGLNSGMQERDFERKMLNLVIVLDISGSMGSPFDAYYYDRSGQEIRLDSRERDLAKIEVAKDALLSIIDQLDEDDHLGIVLFNNREYLLQPMRPVGRTDIYEMEDNIYEIMAGGGTNLSAGMKLGTELLEEYIGSDPYEFENRIIFLTDAMPNTGVTGEYGLLRQLKNNAKDQIYTTFIGIGVDFNSELVETISKTKGSNYYSVHSPRDFMYRMDEEFDYMVTPLVFDLEMSLDARDWDIEMVYGSPEADKASGELMYVNTLFPSKKVDGETRGGLILLKLKKRGDRGGPINLRVSYEDREGRQDSSETTIYLEDTRPEYFDNDGIRKGILLARYADLMQDWIIDEREHASWSRPWEPRVNEDDGIVVPPTSLGRWERGSLPLMVSPEYRRLFREFIEYFEDEMYKIGDRTLEQELDILDELGGYRG